MAHAASSWLTALALLGFAACAPDDPEAIDGRAAMATDIPPPDQPEAVVATALLEPVASAPPVALDAGALAMTESEAGAPSSDGESGAEPIEDGPAMTFFVTSVGMGTGGDLGGLTGGDAHCQRLARRAGAGDRTWQAMLSSEFVDSRSRIGEGPWHNHAGVLIGASVDELFERGIPFGRERTRAMLDEYGEPVPSSSHDILSGCDDVGVRVVGGNCVGWTSNADFDAAIVGHSDSSGAQGNNPDRGWVSAHLTGCSQASLANDGGDARLYCFAID